MAETSTPRSDPLSTPLQFVKGAGPRRAEQLAKLGLHTVADLIFWLPRDYEVHGDVRRIAELEEGAAASFEGTVEDVELRQTRPGRSILGVLLSNDGEHLRCVWFNQPYLAEKFSSGQRLLVSGKPKLRLDRWEMAQPRWQILAPDEPMQCGEVLPVYSLTEGIKQWQMRRLIRHAVQMASDQVEDVLPPEYLAEHRLMSLDAALRGVHLPESRAKAEQARHRFVYEELLLLQLAMALRRLRQRTLSAAPALECSAKIDARIRRVLPFELTPGQNAVIGQIVGDMARPVPMGRLLQGDVGSGKTAVAVYAALLAVARGKQVAFMAPTEVLAQQHLQTLRELLTNSRVRLAALTGNLSAGERKQVLAECNGGNVDILIGTHALIESGAALPRLGLVAIDEQHKFGVRQRAALRKAGKSPHYLVMTATPIPRSIALTLFGDLEVSLLKDSPRGRQPVQTYIADDDQRERWWAFVKKKLQQGRQAYIVAPSIDDTPTAATRSLEEVFRDLSQGALRGHKLAVLHGRMAPAEKSATMEDFRNRRTQALVCTSIIEVGIDVPNATVMTIEGADRFGLAQLHQIRGRISRGSQPGFCCCFAKNPGEEAHHRLQAFASITDGFELAELDFLMRGPGELFGSRQHGLPPLRIADLNCDLRVLEQAREDARRLVAEDPGLVERKHAQLRNAVLERYGHSLELGDAG